MPKGKVQHLTPALEAAIQTRIRILEETRLRDERAEGQLLALQHVLYLARTLEA